MTDKRPKAFMIPKTSPILPKRNSMLECSPEEAPAITNYRIQSSDSPESSKTSNSINTFISPKSSRNLKFSIKTKLSPIKEESMKRKSIKSTNIKKKGKRLTFPIKSKTEFQNFESNFKKLEIEPPNKKLQTKSTPISIGDAKYISPIIIEEEKKHEEILPIIIDEEQKYKEFTPISIEDAKYISPIIIEEEKKHEEILPIIIDEEQKYNEIIPMVIEDEIDDNKTQEIEIVSGSPSVEPKVGKKRMKVIKSLANLTSVSIMNFSPVKNNEKIVISTCNSLEKTCDNLDIKDVTVKRKLFCTPETTLDEPINLTQSPIKAIFPKDIDDFNSQIETINKREELPEEPPLASCSSTISDIEIDSEAYNPKKKGKKGSLLETVRNIVSNVVINRTIFDIDLKIKLDKKNRPSSPLKVLCIEEENKTFYLHCLPVIEIDQPILQNFEELIESLIVVIVNDMPKNILEGCFVTLYFPLTIISSPETQILYIYANNQIRLHKTSLEPQIFQQNQKPSIIKKRFNVIKSNVCNSILDLVTAQLLTTNKKLYLTVLHIYEAEKLYILLTDKTDLCRLEFETGAKNLIQSKKIRSGSVLVLEHVMINKRIPTDIFMEQFLKYLGYVNDCIYGMVSQDNFEIIDVENIKTVTNISDFNSIEGRLMVKIENIKVQEGSIYGSDRTGEIEVKNLKTEHFPVVLDGIYFDGSCLICDSFTSVLNKEFVIV